uniref:Uncharacterized protein n=1 Tax=Arundo donax TaxID=35708 RepID=A0A0A9C2W5_ARUDO
MEGGINRYVTGKTMPRSCEPGYMSIDHEITSDRERALCSMRKTQHNSSIQDR